MNIISSIIQHELIGLEAKVVKSSNPYNMGISGRVMDETRNTLVILHRDKEKVIVKNSAGFQFTLPDGTVVEVDGKVLVGRPEDRLKRAVRRRW